MDGFLLVVPFLGDFYISCRTGFSNLLMSWFYRGAFPFSFYMEDVLSHLTRVFRDVASFDGVFSSLIL